jgi:hypothetical protein
MLAALLMVMAASQPDPTLARQDSDTTACQFGAVYKAGSGQTLIVRRFGTGWSSFQANGTGPKQAGMALDFVLTDGGEKGAIYGPMRSQMFPIDLRTLDRLGYSWKPAPADPGGFFRVLSHDGQDELFTLTYVGCARTASRP